MATIIRGSGGSGGKAASNALIANTDANMVLLGEEFVDSNGDISNGAMPINEATTINLGLGGSYTIPAGYHTGEGLITVGPNTVVEVRTVTVTKDSPLVNKLQTTSVFRASSVINCNEGDIVVVEFHHVSSRSEVGTGGRVDVNTNPNAPATDGMFSTWQTLFTVDDAAHQGASGYFISKNTSSGPISGNNAYRAIRFVMSINSNSDVQLVGTAYIIHTQ